MIVTEGRDAIERDLGFFELAGVETGACGGQVENLDDGSANDTLERHVPTGDVISSDAPLLAGRTGKCQESRFACQAGVDLNGIADRVNIRVGGLHMAVDTNMTAGFRIQTGVFCQIAV